MGLPRSWILLVLVLLTIWSSVRSDDDAEDPDPIAYQCGTDSVLTLYNRSADYAITQCSIPTICGQPKTCIITTGPACIARFQYVTGITELPDGKLQHICCQTTPLVEGEESCYDIDILDKTYHATVGEGLPPALVRYTQLMAAKNQQMGAPRSKRQTPLEATFKADVALVATEGIRPSVEFIKGIHKFRTGIRVTVCTPHCHSSTSTVTRTQTQTRTPPTQRPTEKPKSAAKSKEKNNQHPKKSLFGSKNGGQGAGGHGCFSADMTVMTPQGLRRMDELHAGDEVTVLSAESQRRYHPIEWFYHRDIDQIMDFVHLETKSGRHLSLTSNHLLPLIPCTSSGLSLEQLDRWTQTSSKFASRAKLGMCLAIKHHNSTDFFADPILKITISKKRGVFSPITSQGTLVVNGVQASCYSSFENQAVQKTVHGGLITANRFLKSMWGLIRGDQVRENGCMEQGDIPAVLSLLLKVAKHVLPAHTYM